MKKIIEILNEIHPEFDYSNSQDFIGDGLLDSLAVFQLLAKFEAEFGIRIKGEDITPETFANIESLNQLIKKYSIHQEE